MNTIKVSDEHLKTIKKALDLYMRCSIGQFERIVDLPSINTESSIVTKSLELQLKQCHKYYTGHENGGPGIHNKEQVTDDARDAMNIHDQIRHHLWKKGDQKYEHTVDAYDAMVKLIEIE